MEGGSERQYAVLGSACKDDGLSVMQGIVGIKSKPPADVENCFRCHVTSTWKVVGHAGLLVTVCNLDRLEALRSARLRRFVDECELESVLVGSAAAAADCGKFETGGRQDFHECRHDLAPICRMGMRKAIIMQPNCCFVRLRIGKGRNLWTASYQGLSAERPVV